LSGLKSSINPSERRIRININRAVIKGELRDVKEKVGKSWKKLKKSQKKSKKVKKSQKKSKKIKTKSKKCKKSHSRT
jgi:hypothetical protein